MDYSYSHGAEQPFLDEADKTFSFEPNSKQNSQAKNVFDKAFESLLFNSRFRSQAVGNPNPDPKVLSTRDTKENNYNEFKNSGLLANSDTPVTEAIGVSLFAQNENKFDQTATNEIRLGNDIVDIFDCNLEVTDEISIDSIIRLLSDDNINQSTSCEDDKFQNFKESPNLEPKHTLISDYSQEVFENNKLFIKCEVGENQSDKSPSKTVNNILARSFSVKEHNEKIKNNTFYNCLTSKANCAVDVDLNDREKTPSGKNMGSSNSSNSPLPCMPLLLSHEREDSQNSYSTISMEKVQKTVEQESKNLHGSRRLEATKTISKSFQSSMPEKDKNFTGICTLFPEGTTHNKDASFQMSIPDPEEIMCDSTSEVVISSSDVDVIEGDELDTTGNKSERPYLPVLNISSNDLQTAKVTVEKVLGCENEIVLTSKDVLDEDVDVCYSKGTSFTVAESPLDILGSGVRAEGCMGDYFDSKVLLDENSEYKPFINPFYRSEKINTPVISGLGFPLTINSFSKRSDDSGMSIYDNSENLNTEIENIDDILDIVLGDSMNFDFGSCSSPVPSCSNHGNIDDAEYLKFPVQFSEHSCAPFEGQTFQNETFIEGTPKENGGLGGDAGDASPSTKNISDPWHHFVSDKSFIKDAQEESDYSGPTIDGCSSSVAKVSGLHDVLAPDIPGAGIQVCRYTKAPLSAGISDRIFDVSVVPSVSVRTTLEVSETQSGLNFKDIPNIVVDSVKRKLKHNAIKSSMNVGNICSQEGKNMFQKLSVKIRPQSVKMMELEDQSLKTNCASQVNKVINNEGIKKKFKVIKDTALSVTHKVAATETSNVVMLQNTENIKPLLKRKSCNSKHILHIGKNHLTTKKLSQSIPRLNCSSSSTTLRGSAIDENTSSRGIKCKNQQKVTDNKKLDFSPKNSLVNKPFVRQNHNKKNEKPTTKVHNTHWGGVSDNNNKISHNQIIKINKNEINQPFGPRKVVRLLCPKSKERSLCLSNDNETVHPKTNRQSIMDVSEVAPTISYSPKMPKPKTIVKLGLVTAHGQSEAAPTISYSPKMPKPKTIVNIGLVTAHGQSEENMSVTPIKKSGIDKQVRKNKSSQSITPVAPQNKLKNIPFLKYKGSLSTTVSKKSENIVKEAAPINDQLSNFKEPVHDKLSCTPINVVNNLQSIESKKPESNSSLLIFKDIKFIQKEAKSGLSSSISKKLKNEVISAENKRTESNLQDTEKLKSLSISEDKIHIQLNHIGNSSIVSDESTISNQKTENDLPEFVISKYKTPDDQYPTTTFKKPESHLFLTAFEKITSGNFNTVYKPKTQTLASVSKKPENALSVSSFQEINTGRTLVGRESDSDLQGNKENNGEPTTLSKESKTENVNTDSRSPKDLPVFVSKKTHRDVVVSSQKEIDENTPKNITTNILDDVTLVVLKETKDDPQPPKSESSKESVREELISRIQKSPKEEQVSCQVNFYDIPGVTCEKIPVCPPASMIKEGIRIFSEERMASSHKKTHEGSVSIRDQADREVTAAIKPSNKVIHSVGVVSEEKRPEVIHENNICDRNKIFVQQLHYKNNDACGEKPKCQVNIHRVSSCEEEDPVVIDKKTKLDVSSRVLIDEELGSCNIKIQSSSYNEEVSVAEHLHVSNKFIIRNGEEEPVSCFISSHEASESKETEAVVIDPWIVSDECNRMLSEKVESTTNTSCEREEPVVIDKKTKLDVSSRVLIEEELDSCNINIQASSCNEEVSVAEPLTMSNKFIIRNGEEEPVSCFISSHEASEPKEAEAVVIDPWIVSDECNRMLSEKVESTTNTSCEREEPVVIDKKTKLDVSSRVLIEEELDSCNINIQASSYNEEVSVAEHLPVSNKFIIRNGEEEPVSCYISSHEASESKEAEAVVIDPWIVPDECNRMLSEKVESTINTSCEREEPVVIDKKTKLDVSSRVLIEEELDSCNINIQASSYNEEVSVAEHLPVSNKFIIRNGEEEPVSCFISSHEASESKEAEAVVIDPWIVPDECNRMLSEKVESTINTSCEREEPVVIDKKTKLDVSSRVLIEEELDSCNINIQASSCNEEVSVAEPLTMSNKFIIRNGEEEPVSCFISSHEASEPKEAEAVVIDPWIVPDECNRMLSEKVESTINTSCEREEPVVIDKKTKLDVSSRVLIEEELDSCNINIQASSYNEEVSVAEHLPVSNKFIIRNGEEEPVSCYISSHEASEPKEAEAVVIDPWIVSDECNRMLSEKVESTTNTSCEREEPVVIDKKTKLDVSSRVLIEEELDSCNINIQASSCNEEVSVAEPLTMSNKFIIRNGEEEPVSCFISSHEASEPKEAEAVVIDPWIVSDECNRMLSEKVESTTNTSCEREEPVVIDKKTKLDVSSRVLIEEELDSCNINIQASSCNEEVSVAEPLTMSNKFIIRNGEEEPVSCFISSHEASEPKEAEAVVIDPWIVSDECNRMLSEKVESTINTSCEREEPVVIDKKTKLDVSSRVLIEEELDSCNINIQASSCNEDVSVAEPLPVSNKFIIRNGEEEPVSCYISSHEASEPKEAEAVVIDPWIVPDECNRMLSEKVESTINTSCEREEPVVIDKKTKLDVSSRVLIEEELDSCNINIQASSCNEDVSVAEPLPVSNKFIIRNGEEEPVSCYISSHEASESKEAEAVVIDPWIVPDECNRMLSEKVESTINTSCEREEPVVIDKKTKLDVSSRVLIEEELDSCNINLQASSCNEDVSVAEPLPVSNKFIIRNGEASDSKETEAVVIDPWIVPDECNRMLSEEVASTNNSREVSAPKASSRIEENKNYVTEIIVDSAPVSLKELRVVLKRMDLSRFIGNNSIISISDNKQEHVIRKRTSMKGKKLLSKDSEEIKPKVEILDRYKSSRKTNMNREPLNKRQTRSMSKEIKEERDATAGKQKFLGSNETNERGEPYKLRGRKIAVSAEKGKNDERDPIRELVSEEIKKGDPIRERSSVEGRSMHKERVYERPNNQIKTEIRNRNTNEITINQKKNMTSPSLAEVKNDVIPKEIQKNPLSLAHNKKYNKTELIKRFRKLIKANEQKEISKSCSEASNSNNVQAQQHNTGFSESKLKKNMSKNGVRTENIRQIENEQISVIANSTERNTSRDDDENYGSVFNSFNDYSYKYPDAHRSGNSCTALSKQTPTPQFRRRDLQKDDAGVPSAFRQINPDTTIIDYWSYLCRSGKSMQLSPEPKFSNYCPDKYPDVYRSGNSYTAIGEQTPTPPSKKRRHVEENAGVPCTSRKLSPERKFANYYSFKYPDVYRSGNSYTAIGEQTPTPPSKKRRHVEENAGVSCTSRKLSPEPKFSNYGSDKYPDVYRSGNSYTAIGEQTPTPPSKKRSHVEENAGVPCTSRKLPPETQCAAPEFDKFFSRWFFKEYGPAASSSESYTAIGEQTPTPPSKKRRHVEENAGVSCTSRKLSPEPKFSNYGSDKYPDVYRSGNSYTAIGEQTPTPPSKKRSHVEENAGVPCTSRKLPPETQCAAPEFDKFFSRWFFKEYGPAASSSESYTAIGEQTPTPPSKKLRHVEENAGVPSTSRKLSSEPKCSDSYSDKYPDVYRSVNSYRKIPYLEDDAVVPSTCRQLPPETQCAAPDFDEFFSRWFFKEYGPAASSSTEITRQPIRNLQTSDVEYDDSPCVVPEWLTPRLGHSELLSNRNETFDLAMPRQLSSTSDINPDETPNLLRPSTVDNSYLKVEENAGVPCTSRKLPPETQCAAPEFDKFFSRWFFKEYGSAASSSDSYTAIGEQTPTPPSKKLRHVEENAGVPSTSRKLSPEPKFANYYSFKYPDVYRSGNSYTAIGEQTPTPPSKKRRHVEENAGVPCTSRKLPPETQCAAPEFDKFFSRWFFKEYGSAASSSDSYTAIGEQTPTPPSKKLRHVEENAGVPSTSRKLSPEPKFANYYSFKYPDVYRSGNSYTAIGEQTPTPPSKKRRHVEENAGVPCTSRKLSPERKFPNYCSDKYPDVYRSGNSYTAIGEQTPTPPSKKRRHVEENAGVSCTSRKLSPEPKFSNYGSDKYPDVYRSGNSYTAIGEQTPTPPSKKRSHVEENAGVPCTSRKLPPETQCAAPEFDKFFSRWFFKEYGPAASSSESYTAIGEQTPTPPSKKLRHVEENAGVPSTSRELSSEPKCSDSYSDKYPDVYRSGNSYTAIGEQTPTPSSKKLRHVEENAGVPCTSRKQPPETQCAAPEFDKFFSRWFFKEYGPAASSSDSYTAIGEQTPTPPSKKLRHVEENAGVPSTSRKLSPEPKCSDSYSDKYPDVYRSGNSYRKIPYLEDDAVVPSTCRQLPPETECAAPDFDEFFSRWFFKEYGPAASSSTEITRQPIRNLQTSDVEYDDSPCVVPERLTPRLGHSELLSNRNETFDLAMPRQLSSTSDINPDETPNLLRPSTVDNSYSNDLLDSRVNEEGSDDEGFFQGFDFSPYTCFCKTCPNCVYFNKFRMKHKRLTCAIARLDEDELMPHERETSRGDRTRQRSSPFPTCSYSHQSDIPSRQPYTHEEEDINRASTSGRRPKRRRGHRNSDGRQSLN